MPDSTEMAAPAAAEPSRASDASPTAKTSVEATQKPQRFQAPIDVTGLTLSTGRPLAADDSGVVTAPDDLTGSELAQILAAGFVTL